MLKKHFLDRFFSQHDTESPDVTHADYRFSDANQLHNDRLHYSVYTYVIMIIYSLAVHF
jgi:hypothetical protein